MSIGESGIRLPHDGLQLEELGHEARSTVVDLLVTGMDYQAQENQQSSDRLKIRELTSCMGVRLDVPERVVPGWIFVAGDLHMQWVESAIACCVSRYPTHLLLLKPPIRKFRSMREQVTSRHHMTKPEMTSEGPETFPRDLLILATSRLRRDLDEEVIIGVSSKSVKHGMSAVCAS